MWETCSPRELVYNYRKGREWKAVDMIEERLSQTTRPKKRHQKLKVWRLDTREEGQEDSTKMVSAEERENERAFKTSNRWLGLDKQIFHCETAHHWTWWWWVNRHTVAGRGWGQAAYLFVQCAPEVQYHSASSLSERYKGVPRAYLDPC